MDLHPYWRKQTPETPLFPDIEWNKPEQRAQAGRLGIIGGNKLGFVGAGDAYMLSLSAGAGEVRVLLPDVLKKTVPSSITEIVFGATTPSGSLGRDALGDMKAVAEWSTGVLLIGDAGRNSETAIVYEDFVREYSGQLTITRDAIDLLRSNPELIAERPNTLLVMSFAQLQKLFQSVYYPKMLTFSMQLAQVVEALHKFTITYPATLMVFHQNNLIVAHNGIVTTTPWENPMAVWKGSVATQAATYLLWSQTKPLEAVTASLAV